MKRLLLAAAATLLLTPAAYAQCAGCDADFNKAEREKADREAKEQSDKADKQQLKEALGDGMARDAAEKMEKHNERNEKALEAVDKPD